jgi:hypothetical protein
MFVLAIFSILSFGFVANSHAASAGQNGPTIFDGTSLVRAAVKDLVGVELGKITDLVITSHGNVDFAIVGEIFPPSADDLLEHFVAVPFS